jgi:cyanophycin synthetase
MQPLDIRRILTLRGPNIWANYPVLEAWVDLGELNDTCSDSVPGFNDRLKSWLPGMIEHRCSIGERGGFFQRLETGTYPAHILEHVTLELQTLAGTPVGYGKASATSEDGVYKVVVRYRDENLARECLLTARELLLAAIDDRPFDVAGEVQRLQVVADHHCLGPSTVAILEAARIRGIPHRRLDAVRSLMQLGYGAKQHRIWTAETDRTGAIAECIAQDKDLTKALLHAAGVPVPEGRIVSDPDDAWTAAREIGIPVVVKPLNGNHGRGVFLGLSTREQIAEAFHHAAKEGDGVIVERLVSGLEHRLLVVGKKVVAASRGEPIVVIGDGMQTVTELIIHQVNTDPRRGVSDDFPLDLVNTEQYSPVILAELGRQGFDPDSVPPSDVHVTIDRGSNLAHDVTDLVHPDVCDRAILAAQVVGLDVCGIDLVCQDISRPLEEQWGAIVEVNSSPGLQIHLKPASGKPRPVGEAIVDILFPHGETGRIPIVAVTGTNGKTTTTRLIAHILQGTDQNVCMACTDGIYYEGRRIDTGDCSGPQSARSVLLNPRTEVAVLEVARGGILREGLGFDRCQVGVVLNVGEADHLGGYYVDTVEAMAKVKRCVIDVVLPEGMGILNADDPIVAEMASACKGKVTFFATSAESEVVAKHIQSEGRAVFARIGEIVLADGQAERVLCSLASVPITCGGAVRFQIENVLAATAACWGLGVSDELIRSGLASFRSDPVLLPGRSNVFSSRGATVLVDNCHNAQAIKALSQLVEILPHTRRGIVFTCGKDRRDIDIIRQAEVLAESFDRIWLYENGRGSRAEGQIISLLRQGLQQSSRAIEVHCTSDFDQAIEAASGTLESGDLLVIQAHDIDATLGAVRRLLLPNETVERSNAGFIPGRKTEISVL